MTCKYVWLIDIDSRSGVAEKALSDSKIPEPKVGY